MDGISVPVDIGASAGYGAITYANGSLVNSSSRAGAGARQGVVHLTGLGALTTQIRYGQALNPEGPDSSVLPVPVQLAGVASPNVAYAGIKSVYPGLYQIKWV